MTTVTGRFTVLLALASIAGIASARIDLPWDGGYFGVNVGDASSSTCNSWALSGPMIDGAIASEFNNRDCATSGALVGGVQVGENFQYQRLMLGIAADLDFWSAKDLNQSLKYSGAAPPPGSYDFSSKQGPSEFAVIGPRIGYAGDTWLPYLRMGAVITAGSHNSRLSYTPAGATIPTASFGGGKDLSTTGWAAGGGVEVGLNGAWSISAEYLHVSLGKGSDSTATCNGSVSACAALSGIAFENSHEGFSANLFRVGVTYWFGYW
jgi:outer membrane immunogenic protein